MTTQPIKAAYDNSLPNSPPSEKQNCYDGALQSIIEMLARTMVAQELAANDNRAPMEDVS
jgi:hypothetical protein